MGIYFLFIFYISNNLTYTLLYVVDNTIIDLTEHSRGEVETKYI